MHKPNTLSRLGGAIDVVYNHVRRRVQSPAERWFREGYGDLPRYFSAFPDVDAPFGSAGAPEPPAPVSDPLSSPWP